VGGQSRAEMLAGLDAYLEDRPHLALVSGTAVMQGPGVGGGFGFQSLVRSGHRSGHGADLQPPVGPHRDGPSRMGAGDCAAACSGRTHLFLCWSPETEDAIGGKLNYETLSFTRGSGHRRGLRRTGEAPRLVFLAAAPCVGSGDHFHGICRRGDLSRALVFDAGGACARAQF